MNKRFNNSEDNNNFAKALQLSIMVELPVEARGMSLVRFQLGPFIKLLWSYGEIGITTGR